MSNLETIHLFSFNHEYKYCIQICYPIKIDSNAQLMSSSARDKRLHHLFMCLSKQYIIFSLGSHCTVLPGESKFFSIMYKKIGNEGRKGTKLMENRTASSH